ncbi:amidohydrolase, partial [Mycolicibacterium sp. XJ1904]
DEINKMTYQNAMRWYHWDPFTHISREQATVGALREAAEGHDVSIQALSKHEREGGASDWQAQMKKAAANVSGTTGD